MLLNNHYHHESDKTIFNKIPELFEIAKLAPNYNDQLNLINKIDNRLYPHNTHPLINPLNYSYKYYPLPNTLTATSTSSLSTITPMNNEYLERDKLLKEWVWKSFNYRTFVIYAHLTNFSINFNDSNKYIDLKTSNTINSATPPNILPTSQVNELQFTLNFDNGEALYTIQIETENFLTFLSLKSQKELGCYHSIEENFYKDIIIDLKKSFKKHSPMNLSFDVFKSDINKQRLNSLIIELLKEHEIPQKNEIAPISLMDNFINQLYYYGSINVKEDDEDDEDNIEKEIKVEKEEEKEIEITVETKEEEGNNVDVDDNEKEKDEQKEKEVEQDEKEHLSSYHAMDIDNDDDDNKSRMTGDIKEEVQDANETKKNQSMNDYRPSWWKEVVFDAFEDLRSQLWRQYQIKNYMTKAEFILWALKYGKIVKDDELWQAFMIRYQKEEKKKKGKEEEKEDNKNNPKKMNNADPTTNESQKAKQYDSLPLSLSDEQQSKLENTDCTEEIKSFLYDILFTNVHPPSEKSPSKKSSSVTPTLSTSTSTLTPPLPFIHTVFFHEKEWNQMLKLILCWLKESQFKVNINIFYISIIYN